MSTKKSTSKKTTSKKLKDDDDFNINPPKSDLIIFDLDGTIMNSDDFILTIEQAYNLEPSLFINKPNKNKNDFCQLYLQKHHHEIQPFEGIFKLFVLLCLHSNVAIVTSRHSLLKSATVEWLKKYTLEFFDESIWRLMKYKLIFNDEIEKSLVYKKRVFQELAEIYNIQLLIEDHPEVVAYAKSIGINVLVPSTGYKNLNNNDLSAEDRELEFAIDCSTAAVKSIEKCISTQLKSYAKDVPKIVKSIYEKNKSKE